MSERYILNAQNEPELCEDLFAWGRWMGSADNARRVAYDETPNGNVSTVFLGLDHRFGSGAPLLYETMVFGGTLDGEQDRYTTRAEAVVGHAAILGRVRNDSRV